MAKKKAARLKTLDLDTLDFEGAMQQLEELVHRLEEGSLSLDGSIQSFEQGMELVRYCAGELRRAEQRVQELTEEAGKLRLTEFAPEQE